MPKRVTRHAVTQPQNPTIRLIALTQNQNTIVDTTDYDWLMQWNWSANWAKCTKSFYAVRQEEKRPYRHKVYMHRIVLGLGTDDKREGDHINHITLDNRRSNLRIVTRLQNMMNRRKNRNNTSGYKGVSRARTKWKAQIRANGRTIYLGCFATPEAAHAAYCEAAKKLHGEFAKLN